MDKCRLCYTDTNPEMCQHIFNTKSEPPIWKIIEQLSNLIITKSDPFTKNICGQCFSDLVKYSDFRRQILDTDYRIQHEKEQLSAKTSDDYNYFEVHFTSITSDNDDFMIKEEQIKIEDDPLKIEDESNEDTKEFAIIDGIYNNDKITECFTSPEDNSNETNERQSSKCSTDDKIVFTRDSTETDRSYTISTNNNDLRLTDNDDIIISDGNKISNAIDVVRSKNFGYGSYMSLKLHNRKTLRNKREPFKCTICNKQFSRKRNLLNHERVHTGEKPFKCIICNKQFSQNESLLRHKRIHTGEKPFKCTICNKQFPQRADLLRHERVHTGEKPFKCTICSKQFSDKTNLVHHERVHTGEKPFKCTICNEQFSNKSRLLRHKRLHTGKKPFKCEICNKSFSSRQHLNEHLNIHTGEKPYCCNICNKTFTFKSGLNVHLKLHNERVPV